MKNNLKLLTMMLAILMLAVSSCKDDNETEPLSQPEAEAVFTTMGDEMNVAMQEMMTTPAAGALMNFMLLTDTDEDIKSSSLPLVPGIEFVMANNEPITSKAMGAITRLASATQSTNPLAYTGTFTWDIENSAWIYSDQPADKLVYVFPSSLQQTANDARLTLSDYTGVEQGEDSFPTSFSVSMELNETTVLNIDYDADLAAESLNSVDINVLMTPFEMGATLTVTPNQGFVTINAGFDLKKLNVILTSANVELRVDGMESINPFADDEEEEEEEKLVPTTAKGYLQMGEVKAQIDLSVASFLMAKVTAKTPAEIEDAANEYLLVTFYTFPEGEKLGIVVWKYDVTELDIVPYFQFNNGVEKPLEEVLEIESELFDDLFDDIDF